mgnify:CR=1 FL=1
MSMKSFVHFNKGRTARQAHVDLPEGLKDDEFGRDGFYGRQAQLYRRNEPTAYRAAGSLRVRDVASDALAPADETDPRGEPLKLFYNSDCAIHLSRRREPMPFFRRNVTGDEAWFIHQGTGLFETEFGPIPFEPGDYVILPKATTYRLVPEGDDFISFIMETRGELTVPDYGMLGRHAPFDPSLIFVPEPQALESEEGREYEVLVKHGETGGDYSSLFYPFNPCDVEGWKGDLFPFRLNLRDWNPILSDSLHLPPTVHQFLIAPGVMMCHFLPRPAEGKKGAERVPCYHRNIDYDEFALFHGGDFLGIPLPKGQISHSPQGIHHGAPLMAREFSRAQHDAIDRVNWEIIAWDTARPLTPTAAVTALDKE